MINHHDFTHFLSLRIYIMYVDYLCVRWIDYAVRNTSTHSLYAVFCEVCLHGVTCSTTHKLRSGWKEKYLLFLYQLCCKINRYVSKIILKPWVQEVKKKCFNKKTKKEEPTVKAKTVLCAPERRALCAAPRVVAHEDCRARIGGVCVHALGAHDTARKKMKNQRKSF